MRIGTRDSRETESSERVNADGYDDQPMASKSAFDAFPRGSRLNVSFQNLTQEGGFRFLRAYWRFVFTRASPPRLDRRQDLGDAASLLAPEET